MLDIIVRLSTVLGACGVLVAAWQLHMSMKLAQTTFEDSLDQQYRELAANVPMDVWLGKEPAYEDRKKTREFAFQYLDLCNEQVLLRKLGRVSDGRWNGWREGIQWNLGIQSISEVWEEVRGEKSNYFSSLEHLHQNGYQLEPKPPPSERLKAWLGIS